MKKSKRPQSPQRAIGHLFLSSIFAALFLSLIMALSCQKSKEDHVETPPKPQSDPVETPAPSPEPSPSTTPSPSPTPPMQYLYISSGSCYVGSLASEIPAKTITKVDLITGNIVEIIVDYNANLGESIAGIANYDNLSLLVLVEVAGGRRIDRIPKKPFDPHSPAATTWYINNTAFASQLRDIIPLSDGSFLVSKTTAIEKITASRSRALSGTNPWVFSPAGSCATSTTLIPTMVVLNNGNIIYAHAAAAPNNKLGMISKMGYASISDCLTAQNAPTSTALPTAMVYLREEKQLLVSYASSTAGNDFIWEYDVNEDSNTITPSGSAAFIDPSYVRGVSALTYDSLSKTLYVALGSTSLTNQIEKFTYDSTAKKLTRVGPSVFSPATVFHKCISGMFISE